MKSETCSEQYCIKFPNGMTCGKMLLVLYGHLYNTMLDGYYIASGLFFLCTYMTIKVTILSTQCHEEVL